MATKRTPALGPERTYHDAARELAELLPIIETAELLLAELGIAAADFDSRLNWECNDAAVDLKKGRLGAKLAITRYRVLYAGLIPDLTD